MMNPIQTSKRTPTPSWKQSRAQRLSTAATAFPIRATPSFSPTKKSSKKVTPAPGVQKEATKTLSPRLKSKLAARSALNPSFEKHSSTPSLCSPPSQPVSSLYRGDRTWQSALPLRGLDSPRKDAETDSQEVQGEDRTLPEWKKKQLERLERLQRKMDSKKKNKRAARSKRAAPVDEEKEQSPSTGGKEAAKTASAFLSSPPPLRKKEEHAAKAEQPSTEQVEEDQQERKPAPLFQIENPKWDEVAQNAIRDLALANQENLLSSSFKASQQDISSNFAQDTVQHSEELKKTKTKEHDRTLSDEEEKKQKIKEKKSKREKKEKKKEKREKKKEKKEKKEKKKRRESKAKSDTHKTSESQDSVSPTLSLKTLPGPSQLQTAAKSA